MHAAIDQRYSLKLALSFQEGLMGSVCNYLKDQITNVKSKTVNNVTM